MQLFEIYTFLDSCIFLTLNKINPDTTYIIMFFKWLPETQLFYVRPDLCELGGFTRPCFPHDNDHAVVSNDVQQLKHATKFMC